MCFILKEIVFCSYNMFVLFFRKINNFVKKY